MRSNSPDPRHGRLKLGVSQEKVLGGGEFAAMVVEL